MCSLYHPIEYKKQYKTNFFTKEGEIGINDTRQKRLQFYWYQLNEEATQDS